MRLRQRALGRSLIAFATYPRALALLLRNPQIALAPLLAAVAQVLFFKIVPADGGFLGYANTSLVSLITQLLASFALGVAIIGGEDAWRTGRAPFEAAYAGARRRAPDIIVASIGYSFLVYIASLVGGTFGAYASYALTFAATVICVYMLPAAAIGGIPGGATLQISGERVRNAPLAAIVVAAVYFVSIAIVPSLVLQALEPLVLSATFVSGDVLSLIIAVIKAAMWAYVGIVLAKAYGDASYRPYKR